MRGPIKERCCDKRTKGGGRMRNLEKKDYKDLAEPTPEYITNFFEELDKHMTVCKEEGKSFCGTCAKRAFDNKVKARKSVLLQRFEEETQAFNQAEIEDLKDLSVDFGEFTGPKYNEEFEVKKHSYPAYRGGPTKIVSFRTFRCKKWGHKHSLEMPDGWSPDKKGKKDEVPKVPEPLGVVG